MICRFKVPVGLLNLRDGVSGKMSAGGECIWQHLYMGHIR